MAANKTQATVASVDAYLDAIADPERRADCQALTKLMSKATGEPATMWGTSIVGFGSYHYRYESGREGDSCLVGFASRKGDISLYVSAVFPEREALLAKLGKHKTAKACVYLKRLADVDLKVLEQIVKAAAKDTKARHA
ncbi:DUF1801 domain-containing protein [Massilia sp. TS11]|uniref:DUF1801 domain-containing protein n=1 Tax=Massilia sp. TS11 TaxID=2908003 RepID=UPI001EDC0524|nr:DUF1801 domain-containing protein [Massilia sp. TS11]MCG2585941.1 DUF1801 domain-containing protein [Massilia sp. TS11]